MSGGSVSGVKQHCDDLDAGEHRVAPAIAVNTGKERELLRAPVAGAADVPLSVIMRIGKESDHPGAERHRSRRVYKDKEAPR
jgi:hypothetical protein